MPDRFIKLVRDRVGDDRDEVIYKRSIGFTDDDFHWALKRKLIEEALEYLESGEWEELIDVFEVVWALTDVHKKGFWNLKVDAEDKRIERGSFLNRISMWIRRPSA